MKWGKEVYNEVELNTDEEPMVFKAQLFALTGVQPHRQKVMIKGAALKDDTWDNFKPKVKNGATLLLMGSRDEDHLKAPDPAQKTKVSHLSNKSLHFHPGFFCKQINFYDTYYLEKPWLNQSKFLFEPNVLDNTTY